MPLALWYFGLLIAVGSLFVAAFAACLRWLSSVPVVDGYARVVRGGAIGVGVAVIALAASLAAGYQLDDMGLGDMLQNGLLLVTSLGALGSCLAAYRLRASGRGVAGS